MVLGGPRSGTTWAANWLTTDTTLCLHDPLLEFSRHQLDSLTLPNNMRLGISCTSSLLYPDWVLGQKCPKVILYRDVEEINLSLSALGLVNLDEATHLRRIAALGDLVTIVPYEHLFSPTAAEVIANNLGVPFNKARHNLLRQMRVEPMWRHLNIGKDAVKQLVRRIMESQNE